MRFVRFIWKNASRNKRRTSLTIASIAFSLFLLATLRTVLTEFQRPLDQANQSLRLVVRRATSLGDPLPISYYQKLAQVPGVKQVTLLDWFGGIYIEESKSFFPQFSCEPEKFFDMWAENQISPEHLEAFQRERTAAVAGVKLAQRNGWKLGDRITLKGTYYPFDLELTIRGFYTGPDETWLLFHRKYFEESMEEGERGQVGTFWLKAASEAEVPRIMDTVDALFHNTDAETKTETERSFQMGFVTMWGNIRVLIGSLSTIVIFTVLLVVANTMAMNIRERAREIALLKALGFPRKTVLTLLIAESVLISFLGGVIGIFGAKTLYSFSDAGIFGMLFFANFEVLPSTVALGLGLSLLIGVLSAAIPAWHVAGRTVAEGLRRVG